MLRATIARTTNQRHQRSIVSPEMPSDLAVGSSTGKFASGIATWLSAIRSIREIPPGAVGLRP